MTNAINASVFSCIEHQISLQMDLFPECFNRKQEDLSMLGFVLLAVVFSPLLPMIFLFYKYFQSGADRVLISLMMLAVCVLSLFLGEMYERHSSGFDGCGP